MPTFLIILFFFFFPLLGVSLVGVGGGPAVAVVVAVDISEMCGPPCIGIEDMFIQRTNMDSSEFKLGSENIWKGYCTHVAKQHIGRGVPRPEEKVPNVDPL